MGAVVSGLLGGVVFAILVTLAARTQKAARTNSEGWKTLRPGWLLNGMIVACIGMAVLAYYFRFCAVSVRDASTQLTSAYIIIIGFGMAAAYLAWISYGRTIIWKGNDLRVHTITGHDIVRRISDVFSVTKNEFHGEYRLIFRDASMLRFSAYFRGSTELIARLPKQAKAD